jgi:hypothetical protein
VRLSRVELAVVALSVIGLCRLAYFHFAAEPRLFPPREHIDERYQALRALVPPVGEAGYLSDAPPATKPSEDPAAPGTKLYEEAQYALAPLILHNGDDRAPIVVAVLLDPAQLEPLAKAHGLRVLARGGPTFAVLGK